MFLYTFKISIALAIRSIDPLWGYQDLIWSRFGDRSYNFLDAPPPKVLN